MSYTGDRSKVIGHRSRQFSVARLPTFDLRPSSYHLPPTTYDLLRRGFTLMEMMAVITIIGLMLLVVLPAMNKIGGASQITNAARQFSNAMTAARQLAITQNMRTRLVIVYGPTVGGGDPAQFQYMRYSAYAIMGQTSGSTTDFSNNTAQSWRYIQAWKFLPKGVIFDPISSPSATQAEDGNATSLESSTLFDASRSKARINVPFPDDSSTLIRQVVCIEFRPTGQPVSVLSTPPVSGRLQLTSVRLINGTVGGTGGGTSGLLVQGRRNIIALGGVSGLPDPARINCVVLSWDDITGRVGWVQPGS